jgi:hypothetical protein
MNKLACLLALVVVSAGANAKEKMLPLSDADASKLSGKTLVVTRHGKPSFVAMTAGKAVFALLGAGAMIVAGNKIVNDNQIADPADILDHELGPALAKRYSMVLKPATTPMIAVDKAEKIAATQSNADYILDIRSTGWIFAYYPTTWDKYWVAYGVQIQLIDAKSGAQISNLACNAGNNKDPNAPTKDAMLADGAQLLKNITQGFGWACVHVLGKEQFHLADSELTPIPLQYVDVLAKYAAAKPTGNVAAGVVEPVPQESSVVAPAAEAPATSGQ